MLSMLAPANARIKRQPFLGVRYVVVFLYVVALLALYAHEGYLARIILSPPFPW